MRMTVPTNEDRFWVTLRPYLPFYWRMEDKLAIGRSDVLYRLRLRGCNDTGIIELKMFPSPDPIRPFWSKMSVEQGMCLKLWSQFNGGRSWLLIGMGAEWLIFSPDKELIAGNTRAKFTLAQFYAMANNKGQINDAGLKRLVTYLEDAHLGRV